MGSMIQTQSFGRTAHDSTRILFGAAALAEVTQEEADSTLELIQRHGINHIDTAASYGQAEDRLGPFLERYRDDFFLATKTGERGYQAAYDEIRRSLERLRTDHVDLIQLHNLVEEEEWQQAYADDGALKAAVQARDEGLVRFIGVTGHGVTVAAQHRRSLEQFDFDAVLLPYNYPMTKNQQYIEDFEALVEICAERGVAVQTIKAITKAPWADGQEHTASTWYEPLREQEAIDAAVHWVLGRPGVYLNTVGDIHILPLVLDAAERFDDRPTDQQMEALADSWEMAPLFV